MENKPEAYPHIMRDDAPPAYRPGVRFRVTKDSVVHAGGPGYGMIQMYKIEFEDGKRSNWLTGQLVSADELSRYAAA